MCHEMRGVHFEDFAAPGSDVEPWARFYTKGDWLYLAIIAASGAGYETAKNSGVICSGCSSLRIWRLRNLGMSAMRSWIIAICAAANPTSIRKLFMRMFDGRLGSLIDVFLSIASLAIVRRDWRYAPVVMLPLLMAINTKLSMGPVIVIAIAAFVMGWDPYLRNARHMGNPLYPLIRLIG
jgi:predicted exporter